MTQHDSVVFDLDGTLWDVTPTVALAPNNILRKLSINRPPFTVSDIAATIGLPIDEVYRRAFPGSNPEQLITIQHELENEIRILLKTMGATMYEGVLEGLDRLSQTKKLFIVSNCGEDYLENFLEWSNLRPVFTDWECFGKTKQPKSENIKSVVSRNQLRNPVYIGDMTGDHQAALDAGVRYIHVDYGFGEPLFPCERVPTFSRLVELLC